jgi:hypothetical protein
VSLVILALLFGSLGTAIWQYGSLSPVSTAGIGNYTAPLDQLERGQVQIDFSAGKLNVDSLPAESPNFVEANSGMDVADMKANFQVTDSEGNLSLTMEQVERRLRDEFDNRWEVHLTQVIPLIIDTTLAVTDTRLDLTKLSVTELQMDLDIGNYVIELPAAAGTTAVRISSDLANLEITVPDGVAAELIINTSLSALEVDENRFPRKGNGYISPDFESAKNRVRLKLDCSLGRVLVK